MRVIAGEYRSRILAAPQGMATRPTSDRLRETLFNVIGPRVAGSRFADLYAGSGAVGIEAISRGAATVWFAEKARPAVEAIQANLRSLRIARGVTVESGGSAVLLKHLLAGPDRMDLVFVDPPYEAFEEYAQTLQALGDVTSSVLAAGALVVVEHARRLPCLENYGALRRTRLLPQGDAALSFFSMDPL